MSAKSKARTLRDFESDEIPVMWHKEKKTTKHSCESQKYAVKNPHHSKNLDLGALQQNVLFSTYT